MINSNTQEKINNIILSLLVVVGVYGICIYFFDMYYDLNDDMVIKDILSGAYAGSPKAYTNQMLYPIGLAISCLYHVLPDIPVFGIFLCLCFAISFWMISYGIQTFFENYRIKIVAALLMSGVFVSLMLWELVFVQYSVVCGVLAGAACFWFYITPVECTVGGFWKRNVPALFLVWLAFLIRSEMLLLTGPFLAVAGICHWAEAVKLGKEEKTRIGKTKLWSDVFSRKNVCKYVVFVVVLLLGLGGAIGADYLANRSQEWQQYREFFDARTRVYDYTWYPDYEEQQEFYTAQGISEIQYKLIDNYNFGLDESITENTLKAVASYGEKAKMLGSTGYRIKNAVIDPWRRFVSLQDMPYNCFVAVGYGLVLGLAVIQRNKKYILQMLLLLIMRSIPWFYLTFVQRTVSRVIHPLYVIEFLLLLAMLVKELYDRPLWNVEKYYRIAVGGVLFAGIVAALPFSISEVKKEESRREQNLKIQKTWDDYAKNHPENYYYLDVYSTVNFMEKIFVDVDNRQKNYDLLGGWVCHSPLQAEARERYITDSSPQGAVPKEQAESIAEALLRDNFYFVAESSCDPGFMEEFYASRGRKVVLELQDTVGEGENPFLVYRILEQ